MKAAFVHVGRGSPWPHEVFMFKPTPKPVPCQSGDLLAWAVSALVTALVFGATIGCLAASEKRTALPDETH